MTYTVSGDHLLPSPWDNPPVLDSGFSGIRGNGTADTVFTAKASQLYVPGRGECALAIGHHEASWNNGVFEDFTIDIPRDGDDRTFDGIRLRGSAVLRNLLIRGIRGFKKSQEEAFGILVQNRDAGSGMHHGGTLIEDVTILCRPSSDPYETGICVGTINHEPTTPLLWSTVRRCNVVHPSGHSQAGYTGGVRVEFTDIRASGFANFFNNDTGPMNHITITNGIGEVSNAAVRLAASANQPKTNLLLRNAHITYTGPGPFRALEAFNLKGSNISNIVFENVTFSVPLGTRFLAVATDAAHIENVNFVGCKFPPAFGYYAPHMTATSKTFIRVDGKTIVGAGAYEFR